MTHDRTGIYILCEDYIELKILISVFASLKHAAGNKLPSPRGSMFCIIQPCSNAVTSAELWTLCNIIQQNIALVAALLAASHLKYVEGGGIAGPGTSSADVAEGHMLQLSQANLEQGAKSQ